MKIMRAGALAPTSVTIVRARDMPDRNSDRVASCCGGAPAVDGQDLAKHRGAAWKINLPVPSSAVNNTQQYEAHFAWLSCYCAIAARRGGSRLPFLRHLAQIIACKPRAAYRQLAVQSGRPSVSWRIERAATISCIMAMNRFRSGLLRSATV
jgi:hypothetical protein